MGWKRSATAGLQHPLLCLALGTLLGLLLAAVGSSGFQGERIKPVKRLQRTPAAPTRLPQLPPSPVAACRAAAVRACTARPHIACLHIAANSLLGVCSVGSVCQAACNLSLFLLPSLVAGHAGRAQLPWLSPRVPAPPMPAGSSSAAQQGAGGKLERRAGSCKQSDCPKPAVLAAPDMRVRFLAGWLAFVQQRHGMCLRAECTAACHPAALLGPQSLTPCTSEPSPTSFLLSYATTQASMPWEPLLTDEEVQRAEGYYGTGRRIRKVAAKLMAGQPIQVWARAGAWATGAAEWWCCWLGAPGMMMRHGMARHGAAWHDLMLHVLLWHEMA